jgi:hypothetical protein
MGCGQRLFGLISVPLLPASVGGSILHGGKASDIIKIVYNLCTVQAVRHLWCGEQWMGVKIKTYFP